MMALVYISIGTNCGNRYENIKNAIKYIAQFCKILDISSIYLTSPLENFNQPYFYNCVVKIKTDLSAEELLVKLKAIERKMGRNLNDKRYQPRIIDLDILFYEKFIINKKNLCIPHKKLHKRKFVLWPLCELAKGFIHPVLNKKISTLKKLLRDKSQKIKLKISASKLRELIN